MTVMEEQKVYRLNETSVCCPALNLTQEKTAKAEEEVALLEEQSQHYKDELDKALRQIEKLNANSQSVGRSKFPSTVFFSSVCFLRVFRGRVHGCSHQTKLRPETLRIQRYRPPSRIVTPILLAGRPHRRKSEVLTHTHAFSLFTLKC